MLYFNKRSNEDAEQLALLEEYIEQRRRMAAVREVHVLTEEEMREVNEEYQDYLLDVEWLRGGC